MKSVIVFVLISFNYISFANSKTINCKINPEQTLTWVNLEIKKHPKLGQEYKDRLISGMQALNLNLQDGSLQSGQIEADFLTDEPVSIFNSKGLQNNSDFDLTTQVQINSLKNETKVSLLFDGWDHFHYYIKIDELTNKAYLRGTVEYDCSSGPVNVYGVYDCVTE